MPELPEVETIRLQLEKFLIGHRILDIRINTAKIFPDDKNLIINSKITSIDRYGKALIINLDNHYSLMIHLKMTGQLIYRGSGLKHPKLSKNVGSLPNKHTHVIFDLDKNANLFFNDLRKFGYIKILKSSEVASQKFISNLGPEPMKDLTPKYFQNKLAKSSQKIKLFLLDQKKISGIGNIYANDALWLAKISPKRPSNKITKSESKVLLKAIETVLKNGLKYSGASDNSYVTATGEEGSYQDHFLVYGKKGELCPNKCGAKIERILLGGRGSFYCLKCQK